MQKDQEKIFENIKSEISLQKGYLALLITSTIIATLGLLMNSTAVVIGAMIIAPLFWPIIGISFGTIATHHHLLGRSLLVFIVSFIIVLAISCLITLVNPAREITAEIQMRLNPTILDLFIALASSVVGALAVCKPNISSSLAGVAISVALLPPLCVAGIGIAFQSWEIFQGSILLFLANTCAIIFAGIITLYVLNIRPHYKSEEKRWRFGILLSSIFLIGISIPLTLYFIQSIQNNRIQKQVKEILSSQITDIDQTAQIDELRINTIKDNQVSIEATIYIPENKIVTTSQKDEITNALTQTIGQSIDLQLNIVNTLHLRQKIDEELNQRKKEVRTLILEKLTQIDQKIKVEDIAILLPEEQKEGHSTQIDILLRDTEGLETLRVQKDNFEGFLRNQIDTDLQLNIAVLPIQRLDDETEDFKLNVENEVYKVLNTQIKNYEVLSLDIAQTQNLLEVNIIIVVDENTDISPTLEENIDSYLIQEFNLNVETNLKLLRFETIQPIEEIVQ